MNPRGSDPEATDPGAAAAPQGLEGSPRRRVVSAAELRRWLTTQVREHPGCRSVRVIAVSRMLKTAPDGCNWSYSLVVEPRGTPAPVYALACVEEVARGRALFSLAG